LSLRTAGRRLASPNASRSPALLSPNGCAAIGPLAWAPIRLGRTTRRSRHSAIDDRSRLVYSEILTNEKKETAAAFWERANAFYASHGVTVLRVMTDNGSCYRSRLFADALDTITHKFTRPYRPRTPYRHRRQIPDPTWWMTAGIPSSSTGGLQ
jgi:hypothetical protein